LGSAFIGISGLALLLRPAPLGGEEPSAESFVVARRGSVESSLVVVGDLRATESRTISSSLKGDQGKIIRLCEDGQTVQAGDELVGFDPSPFEAAAQAAEVEVQRLQGKVEMQRHSTALEKSQSRMRVRAAEYELELARLERTRFKEGEGPLELARLQAEATKARALLGKQTVYVDELKPLLDQGYVQPAEIEQLIATRDEAARTAQLAEQQANAYEAFILPSKLKALDVAVEKARNAAADSRSSMESKVAEAEAALALAQKGLASAQKALELARFDLEMTTIKAPSSGMFVMTEDFRNGQKRKPRIGDAVWQGHQIAFLPDLSSFQVTGHVREVDLHRIDVGHPGIARFDAYPELEVATRVRSLGALASRDAGGAGSGEKAFRVTIELQSVDPRLRPGMTARVEVESGRATDVIVLPLHAVWRERGKAWCWVVEGDRRVRRSIELGLSNAHMAEIRSGLSVGELVDPYADAQPPE
ncbi:MAG: hypothetical protein AAGG01_08365, partial [Planctomycetota bacterium]